MSDLPNNETRLRLLDVAEELFSQRGYAAVKLRDIAEALGMRHASLYYYAPGGKEQLFVEVMERNLRRHRAGLEQAIAAAGHDLRPQVYAIVAWLLSQPPLDLARMYHADMPAIDAQRAERLMAMAYDTLRLPIVAMLDRAHTMGQIRQMDLDLAAMALVSLVQSVYTIPAPYRPNPLEPLGRQLADMLLEGWRPR